VIVGVDFAAIDGNDDVAWPEFMSACAAAGSQAGFAIFRSAWGTTPDPTVQREWKRAQSHGLVTGAYLYLRMLTDTAPEDQIHVFADNLGPITSKDLVPTLDVEDAGMPAAAELAYVSRACDAMRSIYGVSPMIYTSARVWHENLHDQVQGTITDCPLWLAKPWPWQERTPGQLATTLFAGGKHDPVVPEAWGWGNWWIHQYQGDAIAVPGFSHTVDLSRWNVMRIGETGARVAWVQRRLGWPVTRIYDAAMATQMKAFQVQHGLVADAIVGPKTFTAITWTLPPATPRAA
jgi:GH25 family lysozyme M1 (1,4-beta-N-acetylmuramidase)